MLKIIGTEKDLYKVVDTTNWSIKLMSASDLIATISSGKEIDNCEICKNGVRIYFGGTEPVKVRCKVVSLGSLFPTSYFDDLEGEVWKPVVDNNEQVDSEHWLYEVSNYGRIRQYLEGGSYRLRKQETVGVALCVRLNVGGKSYVDEVAKIVASAFIPKPSEYDYVMFLDNDETNCKVENLAWSDTEWVKPEPPAKEIRCKTIDFVLFCDTDGVPMYELTELAMPRRCADKSFVKLTQLNGVVKVCLRSRGGKLYYVSLGGLVATLFLDRPEGAKGIVFLNGNKGDCGADNLKWVTSLRECDEVVDDMAIMFDIMLKADGPAVRESEREHLVKVIRQYNADGSIVADFKNEKKVQAKLGYSAKRIKEACLSSDHLAYGFIWEYVTYAEDTQTDT